MTRHFTASLASFALVASSAFGQTPCGSFTSTAVPMDPAWWEAELEDVTTLPDGTAWASGHYKTYAPFQPIETFTLAMHWDGQAWSRVATPSPSAYPGGTKTYLHAIAAVAPDDVWAAGDRHGDAGGQSVGAWIMVQHWDGGAWSLVPVPAPPGGVSINFSGTRVEDIVALSEDDVWFGGQWGEPNAVGSVTWRPLAMHWDGSGLEVFETPAPYEDFYGFKIVSMSAVGSDDIWAVCNRLTAGGHAQRFVVLHWDGQSWDLVDVDNAGGMRVLYTVEAIAADDVWIFGEDQWPAGPSDVFALHFDGSGWTEMTGGPPARGAFALDAGSIYTGAGYNIGEGISFFDGAQWTVLEDFPGLDVHVFEGERGVGCSGWIVGREMVGGKKPFAARLVAAGGGAMISYCGTGDPHVTTSCSGSPGSAGHGCANSVHATGASLTGAGSPGDDAVALTQSGEPATSLTIFLQGDASVPEGVAFGDGIRCVGGNLVRLYVVGAVGGVASAPPDGHASIRARSAELGDVIPPGGTRFYQAYYRDPASVSGSSFNVGNALSISWP